MNKNPLFPSLLPSFKSFIYKNFPNHFESQCAFAWEQNILPKLMVLLDIIRHTYIQWMLQRFQVTFKNLLPQRINPFQLFVKMNPIKVSEAMIPNQTQSTNHALAIFQTTVDAK